MRTTPSRKMHTSTENEQQKQLWSSSKQVSPSPMPTDALKIQGEVDTFLLGLPLGSDAASADVELKVAERLYEAEISKSVLKDKVEQWANVAVELHEMVSKQQQELHRLQQENTQRPSLSPSLITDNQLLPAVAASAAAMTASIMSAGRTVIQSPEAQSNLSEIRSAIKDLVQRQRKIEAAAGSSPLKRDTLTGSMQADTVVRQLLLKEKNGSSDGSQASPVPSLSAMLQQQQPHVNHTTLEGSSVRQQKQMMQKLQADGVAIITAHSGNGAPSRVSGPSPLAPHSYVTVSPVPYPDSSLFERLTESVMNGAMETPVVSGRPLPARQHQGHNMTASRSSVSYGNNGSATPSPRELAFGVPQEHGSTVAEVLEERAVALALVKDERERLRRALLDAEIDLQRRGEEISSYKQKLQQSQQEVAELRANQFHPSRDSASSDRDIPLRGASNQQMISEGSSLLEAQVANLKVELGKTNAGHAKEIDELRMQILQLQSNLNQANQDAATAALRSNADLAKARQLAADAQSESLELRQKMAQIEERSQSSADSSQRDAELVQARREGALEAEAISKRQALGIQRLHEEAVDRMKQELLDQRKAAMTSALERDHTQKQLVQSHKMLEKAEAHHKQQLLELQQRLFALQQSACSQSQEQERQVVELQAIVHEGQIKYDDHVQQIADLQSRLGTALGSAAEQKQMHEQRVIDLLNQLEMVQHAASNSAQMVSDLQEQLDEARKHGQQQVEVAEKLSRCQEQEVHELQAHCQELMAFMEAAQQLQHPDAHLTAKARQLELALEASQKQMAACEEQLQQCRRDLGEAEGCWATAVAQRSEAEARLTILQEQHKVEIEVLSDKSWKQEESIELLLAEHVKERESLNHRIESVESASKESYAANKASEARAEEAEARNEALMQTLTLTKCSLYDSEANLNAASKSIHSIEDELQVAKAEVIKLQTQSKDHSETVQIYKNQLVNVEEKAALAVVRVGQLVGELQGEREKGRELASKVEQADFKYDELERAYQGAIARAEEAEALAEETLESMRLSRENECEAIDRAKDVLASKQQAYVVVEAMQSKLDQCFMELKDTEGKLEEAEGKLKEAVDSESRAMARAEKAESDLTTTVFSMEQKALRAGAAEKSLDQTLKALAELSARCDEQGNLLLNKSSQAAVSEAKLVESVEFLEASQVDLGLVKQSLAASLESAQADAAQHAVEVEQLNLEAGQYKRMAEEAQAAVKELQSEVQKWKMSSLKIEHNYEEKKEIEGLRSDLEGTRADLESTRAELVILKTEILQLQEESENLKAHNGDSVTEVRRLQLQYEALQEESDSLRSDLRSSEAQRENLELEAEVHRVEVEQLHVKVHQCMAETGQYKGQVDQYQLQIEQYKESIEQYKIEVGKYKGQVEQYMFELEAAHCSVVDWEAAGDEAKTDLDRLRSELKAMKKIVKEGERTLAQVVSESTAAAESSSGEVARLKGHLESAWEKVEELEEALASSVEEGHKLKGDIQALELNLQGLQNELDTANTRAEAAESRLQDLCVHVAVGKQQLHEARIEHQVSSSAYREADDQEAEFERLLRESEQNAAECRSLQVALEDTRKAAVATETELTRLQEGLARVSEQLDEEHRKSGQLVSALEIEQLRSRGYEQKARELEQIQLESDSHIEDLAAALDEAHAQVKQLQGAANGQASTAADRMKDQLAQANERLKEMVMELDTAKAQIVEMRSENSHLREQAASERSDRSREDERSRSEVQQCKSEIQQYSEMLEPLMEEMERLRRQPQSSVQRSPPSIARDLEDELLSPKQQLNYGASASNALADLARCQEELAVCQDQLAAHQEQQVCLQLQQGEALGMLRIAAEMDVVKFDVEARQKLEGQAKKSLKLQEQLEIAQNSTSEAKQQLQEHQLISASLKEQLMISRQQHQSAVLSAQQLQQQLAVARQEALESECATELIKRKHSVFAQDAREAEQQLLVRLKEQERKLREAQGQVEELKSEVQVLSHQEKASGGEESYAASQQSAKLLQDQVDRLSKELERKGKAVLVMEQELSSLQSQLAHRTDEVRVRSRGLDLLERQLEGLQQQASERERYIRSLEARTAEAEGGDAAGQDARQQVRQLQAKISELQKQKGSDSSVIKGQSSMSVQETTRARWHVAATSQGTSPNLTPVRGLADALRHAAAGNHLMGSQASPASTPPASHKHLQGHSRTPTASSTKRLQVVMNKRERELQKTDLRMSQLEEQLGISARGSHVEHGKSRASGTGGSS